MLIIIQSIYFFHLIHIQYLISNLLIFYLVHLMNEFYHFILNLFNAIILIILHVNFLIKLISN